MGIENLKRWHWCVIGLIVGAAIASVTIWAGPREDKGVEHVGPVTFETQVLRGVDPILHRTVYDISKIVIHPPNNLAVYGGRMDTETASFYVTLTLRGDRTKMQPVQQFLIMQQHTAKDQSIVGDISKMSLREYLTKLQAAVETIDKKRYPKARPLTIRYAWLETPKGAYSVYSLGGLVVIGLIWPTVVNLLAGAGFGRRKEVDEYDLSRFKGSSKSKSIKDGAAVADAEIDKLARLEAELETKLKAGAKPRTAKDAPVAAPAPIRPLSAGPLEAPKEEAKKEQPKKGFGADHGDYYPTEVHGKPKP